jgi:protein-S-isoprenylcysteine O-methyltransferase Ste14
VSAALIFRCLWFLWAAYWLLMARGTKRAASRARPTWALALVPVVAAIAIAMRARPALFAARIVPSSPAIDAAGIAMAVAGFALAIWARRVLGRNWSGAPVIKEDHELVRNGPYRLVRHPIYSGLLLAVFGSCLSEGRVHGATLFVLVLLSLLWKSRVEEGLMARQFPEAYPEYRKRTKALVPFVL